MTAAGAEICGAEEIRAEDAETSEPLDKADENQAEEPTGQKTERHSEPMEEGKHNLPKSGSEERKKKPLEEERAEDGHRHGRRVSEPRELRSLVEGEFHKTAEEESR